MEVISILTNSGDVDACFARAYKPVLAENEFYRVNSYYWQDRIYVVLEEADDKALCKVLGSKSKPSWLPKGHLSKTYVDFKNGAHV